ncbi:MAG: anthranilate synthase component I family protein [Flavobacteriales bacterium]
MRRKYTYAISNEKFIEQLLFWSEKFQESSLLISNNNSENFAALVAVGCVKSISPTENSFSELKLFHDENKDWMFGYLSYDLKNEVENLTSQNTDNLHFPKMMFYIPETIFKIKGQEVFVESILKKNEIDTYFSEINNQEIELKYSKITLKSRETKEEYLSKITKIKKHIQLGDIYEMNYCQEFYSEGKDINPRVVFSNLNKKNNSPFSVFFQRSGLHLLCSSPERYLQKKGNKIISQPIKGTRKRGRNIEEDLLLKNELLNSEKERSENVMITDLVRNDLSKTAKKGSVNVKELFGIYTFDNVHQMITTIESELKENVHFTDVLESTFPMGSMTGVPKIKAMKLIEKYENQKRSLFSGAFGYITPKGDFDFNVVIRSILYNKLNRYVSVMAGGAITINSDELEEFEESELKAKAMLDVLKYEK